MVSKTRAQTAKAVVDSFGDDRTPDYIQIRLQEVVAYLEAQADNEGLIDVTKDIYNKINEIVNHYGRTEDHVKQSSVKRLLSYMMVEPVVPKLSPKALVCLLNLLLVSESGKHRVRGFRVLLEVLRNKSIASVLESSVDGDDRSDSQIDTIANAMRKSLQERIEWESNDEETRQVMTDLLTEFLENTAMLTAESPLDAKSLVHRSDNHLVKIDLNGKRKRHEIPDSFEDLSIFDFTIRDGLEELADGWSNHGSSFVQPAICNQKSQDENLPKVHMNQKRQRKRLTRVTETGSPIPLTEDTSKQDLIRAKRHFSDLDGFRNSSNKLTMDKPQDIVGRPQLATYMAEISKIEGPRQQFSEGGDQFINQKMNRIEGSKAQSGRSEIPDSQIQEAQSLTPVPAHQISRQGSSSPHADQIVFDQYLDFEGDVTILSQYPENIFSSPERPTLTNDPNSSEKLTVAPDTCPSDLLQANGFPSDSGNGEPEIVAPHNTLVATNTKGPQEECILPECPADLTEQKDVLEPAPSLNRHSDTPIIPNTTTRHYSSSTTHRVAETMCTPDTTYAPKESELAQSKISQITTIGDGRDRQDSDGSVPCRPILENVSFLQVQQLVATEVEKVIKGIGTYLCSMSHQDLALGQCCSPELETMKLAGSEDVAPQIHVSPSFTSVRDKTQDEHKISKVSRSSSSLKGRPLDLETHMDPNETVQNHAIQLKSLIDLGIERNAAILSSNTDCNYFSPSSTVPPILTIQQIIGQFQDLNPEITPIFLQAMTLLTNVFRLLDGSQDILNRAVGKYNGVVGESTFSQMSMVFDQGYRKKVQASLSQIGTTIDKLGTLQISCERQSDHLLPEVEKHPKVIALIDLAIKGVERQTAR